MIKMAQRKLPLMECAMGIISFAAIVQLNIQVVVSQMSSVLSPTPVSTIALSPSSVPISSSSPQVSTSAPSPTIATTMAPLFCPEETDPDWGYSWNTTSGGTQVIQSCISNMESTSEFIFGSAIRNCSTTGDWSAVNVSSCQNVLINSSAAQILIIAQTPNLTNATRLELQNANTQLSEETRGTLFPIDLEDVNRALQAVASLGPSVLEGNIVSVETILSISSNALEDRNTPAWSVLVNTSSPAGPSLLLESVEQFTANVGQFVAASVQQGEVTIIVPNVVLNIVVVNMTEAMSDITIDASNLVANMSLIQRTQAPAISLPGDFLAERFASVGMTQRLPITTVIIRNLQNYLPPVAMNMIRTAGSFILSSQVGNESGFSDALLITPITIRFPVILENGRNPLCVFWNFTLDSWSAVGLSEGTVVESQDGVSEVQCLSTHLTSFAILMDVSGTLPPNVALSVLTYIGCGMSIICLILTMIYLISLKRELYQQVNYFVLLNLCIALTCGLIIFCAGIETATPNLVACTIVSVLLHYFFLAAFSWMLCQAVVIYNLLVRVYGAHKRPWLYLYMALGWGIPVPIVALSVGIRYDYYYIRGSLDSNDPAYNNILACWLSSEFGVIYSFVVPLLAIIVVNVVLLGLSLRSLWKSDLGSSVQNIDSKAKSNSVRLARKLIKATVILLPVLGLTWIFGLLSAIPIPHPGQIILSSFFLILNTLQGVFIFWFHVVRSDRVWGWLKDKCFSKCSPKKWKSGETKPSNTASNQVVTLEHSKPDIPLSNYKTADILHYIPQDSTCEAERRSAAEDSLTLDNPPLAHAVSMEFQEVKLKFPEKP